MAENEFNHIDYEIMLTKIRGMHYNYLTKEAPRDKPKDLNWVECRAKNEVKLKCRAEYQQVKKDSSYEMRQWGRCFSLNKAKLKDYCDIYTLWVRREYLILKRMNAHSFPANKILDNMWRSHVNRQVRKINKMKKLRVNKVAMKREWSDVIEQGRRLLHRKRDYGAR